jgi:hypothetical protein
MYRLNLVSEPVCEPLDIVDVKTHLRIDTDDEDAYLESLITVARMAGESYTGRCFITQTYQMFLDSWPAGTAYEPWWNGTKTAPLNIFSYNSSITIPNSPLQSITHIKTYNNADNATTMDPASYQVSTYSGVSPQCGRITLRDGAVWPSVTRNADGIEIEFVCGYGNQSDVPKQIKQALLEEVAYRYINRGDCEMEAGCCSSTCQSLLATIKIREL